MRHDKDFVRNLSCAGKQPFDDYRSAKLAANRQAHAGKQRVKLEVYHCEFCDSYHIGKGKSRKIRGIR